MRPIFKNVLRIPSFKKAEDISVDEIIEAQQEESKASAISSNLLSSRSSNTQFEATKRWNKLVTKFYEKMPRGKHRGLILSYNDTFTGKAAVQFLLSTLFPEVVPNKPVDETNAIKFMELLLKKKLVENVKFPESQFFQATSRAIFRFLTVNIAAEIEATSLKRSNTITNFKSSCNFAASFKPTLDRRISSSCSDLHQFIKAESTIEANGASSFLKPTPFKFSAVLKPTPENAEELQENLEQNRAESQNVKKEVTCDNNRNPPSNNELIQTPSTSLSISDACSTLPSAFSASTYSSPRSTTKRLADFKISSDIPFKKPNQRPMSYYDNSTEFQTASKAEEYLLLLDSIINDELLAENQKQKKLAAFRKTYPQVYLIRFPEAAFTPKPKPRQPTPIRVFNKLIRRNSAKRK